MIRWKKDSKEVEEQWQRKTALWVGKSYRDALLPKHIGLSFILHVIFLVLFFVFAKNYLLSQVHPTTKNLEFNLQKTYKTQPRKTPKIVQNTIAESPAPAKTQSPKQEKQTSNKLSKTSDNGSVKKTTTNTIASSQTTDFSDNDLIPMSKIKRSSSSSGFNRASSGSSGSASDEATSGASGSSQSGVKGSKEITGYDISPYINELRRNIKMNWKVPAGSPNRRVELFLRIAKDGRIMILNVKTTAESADLDESALTAVKRTSPLRPLPSKYPKNYLDVVFVFNPSDASVR